MNKRQHGQRIVHRGGDGRFKKHPGFASARDEIAQRIEAKDPRLAPAGAERQAAAELAAATRRASPEAHKRNPDLNRVKQ